MWGKTRFHEKESRWILCPTTVESRLREYETTFLDETGSNTGEVSGIGH